MVSLSGEEMKYNIGDLIVPSKERFSMGYISKYQMHPSGLEEYQLTWIHKNGKIAQVYYDEYSLIDMLDSGYKVIPVIE